MWSYIAKIDNHVELESPSLLRQYPFYPLKNNILKSFIVLRKLLLIWLYLNCDT